MTVSYGGFWRRFVAISIDTILLYIVNVILIIVVNLIVPVSYDSIYLTDTDSAVIFTALFPYYGMAVMVNAAYFVYFHGMTGRTPGKKMLGLAVVRTDGEPMTFGIAFLRWVGYIVSKIPFFLGFIWAAFDGRKQGWHDKIAGTCVIKTRIYQDVQYQTPPNIGTEPPPRTSPGRDSVLENDALPVEYDTQKEAGGESEIT